MINKCIIICLILIIILLMYKMKTYEKFNTMDDKVMVRGASELNGDINKNTMLVDTGDQFIDKQNLYKLPSEEQTNILNIRGL